MNVEATLDALRIIRRCAYGTPGDALTSEAVGLPWLRHIIDRFEEELTNYLRMRPDPRHQWDTP